MRGVLSSERAGQGPKDSVGDVQFARDLVKSNEITVREFLEARAQKLQIPFVDLAEFSIDKVAIAIIPSELTRKHLVLLLRIKNDELYLGINNPSDTSQ